MRKVVVSHKIPPIYEELKSRFGIDWDKGIIIAYDNTVYCKNPVSPQKLVHEIKHLDRQNEMGNEAWWRLYLESDEFRLQEERLAYVAEAEFIKRNIKNREIKFFAIREIARSFSSEIYGNIISMEEALRILR